MLHRRLKHRVPLFQFVMPETLPACSLFYQRHNTIFQDIGYPRQPLPACPAAGDLTSSQRGAPVVGAPVRLYAYDELSDSEEDASAQDPHERGYFLVEHGRATAGEEHSTGVEEEETAPSDANDTFMTTTIGGAPAAAVEGTVVSDATSSCGIPPGSEAPRLGNRCGVQELLQAARSLGDSTSPTRPPIASQPTKFAPATAAAKTTWNGEICGGIDGGGAPCLPLGSWVILLLSSSRNRCSNNSRANVSQSLFQVGRAAAETLAGLSLSRQLPWLLQPSCSGIHRPDK